mmetsp:Transcript_77934/g.252765  ORF Transcript_77934/g.252765 Transcript_77934/m.252765 type:complete len:539 (+) Transcript_77934:1994-3610(+)
MVLEGRDLKVLDECRLGRLLHLLFHLEDGALLPFLGLLVGLALVLGLVFDALGVLLALTGIRALHRETGLRKLRGLPLPVLPQGAPELLAHLLAEHGVLHEVAPLHHGGGRDLNRVLFGGRLENRIATGAAAVETFGHGQVSHWRHHWRVGQALPEQRVCLALAHVRTFNDRCQLILGRFFQEPPGLRRFEELFGLAIAVDNKQPRRWSHLGRREFGVGPSVAHRRGRATRAREFLPLRDVRGPGHGERLVRLQLEGALDGLVRLRTREQQAALVHEGPVDASLLFRGTWACEDFHVAEAGGKHGHAPSATELRLRDHVLPACLREDLELRAVRALDDGALLSGSVDLAPGIREGLLRDDDVVAAGLVACPRDLRAIGVEADLLNALRVSEGAQALGIGDGPVPRLEICLIGGRDAHDLVLEDGAALDERAHQQLLQRRQCLNRGLQAGPGMRVSRSGLALRALSLGSAGLHEVGLGDHGLLERRCPAEGPAVLPHDDPVARKSGNLLFLAGRLPKRPQLLLLVHLDQTLKHLHGMPR